MEILAKGIIDGMERSRKWALRCDGCKTIFRDMDQTSGIC